MDPQQQPSGPYPPADNSPYQFIMEPPKKQRNNRFGNLGSNPLIMKLIFMAGGLVVLLIIGAIVVNMLFAPTTNVDDIVAVTQAEQEIIRIAGKGEAGSDASTRNAAIGIRLAVTTQQQTWLTYLAKHKRKVPLKELNLTKNTATDTQLAQAKATSTFDGTYRTILSNQLDAYGILLKGAADNATESKEKATLLTHYNQVQLLSQQLPQQ